MKLELYYYKECGFSQSVLNTIKNLKIQDKVVLKSIRENPEFEKELVISCGDNQVPTLIVDDKPMRESEAIKKFLVQNFM
jgi:glutaredoxin